MLAEERILREQGLAIAIVHLMELAGLDHLDLNLVTHRAVLDRRSIDLVMTPGKLSIVLADRQPIRKAKT